MNSSLRFIIRSALNLITRLLSHSRDAILDKIAQQLRDFKFNPVHFYYLSAAWRCRVEDPGLHLTGQSRINRQNDELRNIRPQRLHTLIQELTGGVDLLLSGQKHQDVTWGKGQGITTQVRKKREEKVE